MKPKLLLLLLPFLLLSRSGGRNNDQPSRAAVQITEPEFPQIIPFETGIETEREILLNEVADSIQCILLETNNKCLIRRLKGVSIIQAKEHFFLSRLDKLFQYTKDGKFIRALGRRGGGPGEFNWITQIDMDEEKELAHMLVTTGKIDTCSMGTGRFIRAMKVPNVGVNRFAMLYVQNTIAATLMHDNNGRRKEHIYLPNLGGDALQIFNRWDLFELNS